MEVKKEKFRIRTYECGVDGKIKIFSLMQYLQEIAAHHAEQLGFGIDWLRDINSYWVLSNIRIEISRLPGREDEVTLKTWPSGYSRTIATREFVGKDQTSTELFRAGSEWMVINKNTNRLKNLFKLDLNLPKTGTKALPAEFKRLEPNGDYRQVDVVRVPRSAIDLNGHVNNTEYVRWGIDVLSGEFKLDENIRSVQATYLSEVFKDDALDLLATSREGRQFGVLGRKAGTETNVFLMDVCC